MRYVCGGELCVWRVVVYVLCECVASGLCLCFFVCSHLRFVVFYFRVCGVFVCVLRSCLSLFVCICGCFGV